MRPLVLLCVFLAVAQGEQTPCQRCCEGHEEGVCSQAAKGRPGKCCGQVAGEWYCCPDMTDEGPAKCGHCPTEYRCWTGYRAPRDMCVNSGNYEDPLVESFISLICFMLIIWAVVTCLRRSRQPTPVMHQHHAGMGMAPVCYPATGVRIAQPGQPITATSGVPVAVAYPAACAAGGQPMAHPVAYGAPSAYPAGCAPYPHHGRGHGYGGGTVAMGAGMGFLGGMMMGEALADAGHHGGDYGGGYGGGDDFGGGGGGDFAADM